MDMIAIDADLNDALAVALGFAQQEW